MASMHFWGVEVKAKEPTSVQVEEGQVIHISQATLGELKKDKEPVIIHLQVGDKKFVMGLLNQNTPQLSLDLVLDQDFEISHNWKNGSVHFLGYDSDMPEELYSDFSEDEDIPAAMPLKDNGKPGASAAAKAPAEKGKNDNKVKPEPKMEKGDEDDDSDDDDDDEDDSEDDDDMSDLALDKFGDSDEDDDDDDDEDSSDDDSDSSDEEETPKPDSPKKRSKAVVKTPDAKKAKIATPQKTDGKKGGAHTATPHPSKKAGKSGEKSTPNPKSGGKLSCGSCSKTFNNEIGLQAHTKAKHSK